MKALLKILLMPVSLLLSAFVWICVGLISCSSIMFKLASGALMLLAAVVLIADSTKNGIILILLAFLVSPAGIPLFAVKLLSILQSLNNAIKII